MQCNVKVAKISSGAGPIYFNEKKLVPRLYFLECRSNTKSTPVVNPKKNWILAGKTSLIILNQYITGFI